MIDPKETLRAKARRQSTALWHMSREAVSLSVPEVFKWTDKECLEYLVRVRFGSWDTVSCPYCGAIGRHYWRPLEKRWKCSSCGSTFSITSGTVFAWRKKSLQETIGSILMWVNSAGGQPALELKRHIDTTYNTVFAMQHKLREALVRGYNVGTVNGDIEMDGAHQSGCRSAEKRGKPQVSRPIEPEDDVQKLTETMLTQTGRAAAKKKKKGGAFDPEFGRKLPKDRRILFAIRKRSEIRGKGAIVTRVAIGLSETADVVKSMVKTFIAAPESLLNTDSSPAYSQVGKAFLSHRVVEHAKELIGPNGENNNQAEELNWRSDRAEKGIYLNIEPKYMLDYAVETASRSDTRRLSNGTQSNLALSVAFSVGLSMFWRRFTHGRHRQIELLHPLPQPVRASGPAKGRNPFSNASIRPPR